MAITSMHTQRATAHRRSRHPPRCPRRPRMRPARPLHGHGPGPTTPAATATCSPGPAGSASPSPGAWRAPAPTALGSPASFACLSQAARPSGGQPARPPSPPPTRQVRPLDAEAAARAVQAGQVTVTPKAGTGQVEMIRSLRVARASAVKPAPGHQRTACAACAAGHRPRRAARAAPRPVGDPARPWPRPNSSQARSSARWPRPWSRLDPRQAPPGPIGRDHHPHHTAGPAHRPGGAQAGRAVRIGQDSAGALLAAAGDNPTGCAATPASRCCAGPRRSRRPRARSPATASTAAATAKPTPRCTGSSCPAALGSAHQGLHGTAAQAGQVQKGDHPLPQTLRRPGGVRSAQPDKPQHPHPSRLTSIDGM
jgi:hypothetical protein